MSRSDYLFLVVLLLGFGLGGAWCFWHLLPRRGEVKVAVLLLFLYLGTFLLLVLGTYGLLNWLGLVG
jgi:hypothetical protein